MNLEEGIEGIIDELQGQLTFTNMRVQEALEAGLKDNIYVNRWVGIVDTLEVCIAKLEILIDMVH